MYCVQSLVRDKKLTILASLGALLNSVLLHSDFPLQHVNMSLNLIDNTLHAIVNLRSGNCCGSSDDDVDLLCIADRLL